MLFKITNRKQKRITHAVVLEFVADEGKIYLPYWMIRNLLLEKGDMAQVEGVLKPVAMFSKLQPQIVLLGNHNSEGCTGECAEEFRLLDDGRYYCD